MATLCRAKLTHLYVRVKCPPRLLENPTQGSWTIKKTNHVTIEWLYLWYSWTSKFQKKNQYTIQYHNIQYLYKIQYIYYHILQLLPKKAFNEFAMCVICYPSQQNFTGCHTLNSKTDNAYLKKSKSDPTFRKRATVALILYIFLIIWTYIHDEAIVLVQKRVFFRTELCQNSTDRYGVKTIRKIIIFILAT